MNTLTLSNVLQALSTQARGVLLQQVTDPTSPDYGGVLAGGIGLTQAGTDAGLIATCACAYLGSPAGAAHLLERADLATDHLLRVQRPSGLIDLYVANYDSSPDAAFAVQSLAAVVEIGRRRGRGDPAWAALEAKLELFIRRAATGMLTGGFHTPNHRWVIASALAQALALYPDLPIRPVLDSYLAEGIDISPEGNYIERSAAIYDPICDRSLLIADAQYGFRGARAAVRANLERNLHLLHADGTIETALSRRQDHGTRPLPFNLSSSYLELGLLEQDPVLLRAAQMLWEKATQGEGAFWLFYVMDRLGEPAPSSAALPDDFSQHYPLNGLWRVRRGLLSASFYQGGTRLLELHYGQAEIAGLKISQSYFGVGRFVADALTVQGTRGVLRSQGRLEPRRPGYELPLGKPVPYERYFEMLAERELRPIPLCTSVLEVEEVDGGFDLRYRTLDGMAGVTAQVAVDFAPGGVWETEDTSLMPRAGQVLFLRRGYGSMRYGADVIRIGPGSDAHRTWAMHDSEQAPDQARVLLPFLTPVDHTIQVRCRRGV